MKDFKEKIFEHCLQYVDDLIASYTNNLKDLNDSAANETKRTAGDKHETALALLQTEQNNIRARLHEATSRKHLLESFRLNSPGTYISNGSLIRTNRGYFLLIVALGKIQVEGKAVIALSSASPLGAKMSGLKVNDTFQFNGLNYVIEEIV